MVLDITLSGLWQTRRNPALKVCYNLWGGVAIKGRMRPGAGVWIVDGWIDVAQVDFAHETIDIELPREAGESGLTVYTWKNVEGELLWPLYDDMFAGSIPANHVVVLWAF